MNRTALVLAISAALTAFAAAESTVKITGVHLCCKSCVKGVDKAVATVSGATAASDAEAGTVTLTAPDLATAQKATDALVTAGYFGKPENPEIKLADTSGAKNAKVSSLTVNDVHLCCGKCVKAVDAAVKGVAGVTSHNAEKGAKTFKIEGNFNPHEVFAALQKAGLTGKAVE